MRVLFEVRESVRFQPEPGTTVFSSVMRGEPITATSTFPSFRAVLIVPIRGCLLKYSISCDVVIASSGLCIRFSPGEVECYGSAAWPGDGVRLGEAARPAGSAAAG